ncbi:hypothetical protein [Frondihabitans cladoniiphilus]|uniref:TadE-like protein n=1 Tax=Frondihabitans cladoniiphilus TaxID=715785 RepID=A0ABP8VZI4_9MICO
MRARPFGGARRGVVEASRGVVGPLRGGVVDERGSVTVEFALVLPAVVVLTSAALGASAVSAEAIRLADAAGVAARAVGRGDESGAASALAALAPGATWSLVGEDPVCVRLDERVRLGPLADAVPLSSRACAAASGR